MGDGNGNNILHSLGTAWNTIPHGQETACQIAQIAMRDGVNPRTTNKSGWSPLAIAIKYDQAGLCFVLLQGGANPNDAIPGLGLSLQAVAWRRPALLRMFLNAGADPNIAANGVTPLMQAARLGALENVKILIQAGASVFTVDQEGRSALDYAQRKEYFKSEGVVNGISQDYNGVISFLSQQMKP